MSVLDLWPRRAPGLPPGQREVRRFPRFSDKPLRWAPVPGPVELAVSVDGAAVATVAGDRWSHYEQVEQVSDFHCVTTWTYRDVRWGGVRFLDVMADVLGDDPPPYAVVEAADRQSAIYVTEDLARPDVLLATHRDKAPIDRRHGAPLRLVSPHQYGYKNVKHVVAVDFRSTEPDSALGPKEHLRARVAEEERHATLPNWAVRWPYRFTIIPTAIAAERGLRRSPPS